LFLLKSINDPAVGASIVSGTFCTCIELADIEEQSPSFTMSSKAFVVILPLPESTGLQ
jgi:hypothetical protein